MELAEYSDEELISEYKDIKNNISKFKNLQLSAKVLK